jgi:heterodisulfide reductase subunit C2
VIARTETDPKSELLSFTASGGCINCGTCTAVCPASRENVVLPRRLLRLLHLGREEELLEHAESIYSCLLCRLCEETCPAGVSIPACVRYLRGHINRNVHHLGME